MRLLGIWTKGWLLWAQVFKRGWAWVVFSLGVQMAMEQAIATLPRDDERLMIIRAMFIFSLQLVLSAFSVLILNHYAHDASKGRSTPLLAAMKQNFKYVVIETTRAILPILLWTFALIIPGIIEAIRLYFVPYVVQFDPQYKAGHVDALERSRALCKGRLWKVCGILIFAMILSIVPRFLLNSISPQQSPVAYVMVFFVAVVLELYTYVALYCAYENLAQSTKDTHGTSVSLQGASQS